MKLIGYATHPLGLLAYRLFYESLKIDTCVTDRAEDNILSRLCIISALITPDVTCNAHFILPEVLCGESFALTEKVFNKSCTFGIFPKLYYKNIDCCWLKRVGVQKSPIIGLVGSNAKET